MLDLQEVLADAHWDRACTGRKMVCEKNIINPRLPVMVSGFLDLGLEVSALTAGDQQVLDLSGAAGPSALLRDCVHHEWVF